MVRLLATNGLAAVFEAKRLETGDRVALKWMRPEPGRRRSAHPGMVHEAQLAARIQHPNIIDVYDIDWEGPALYLVMELLEGETLRAAMQRADTPLHALIGMLVEAMRGVAAAHRLGIVHRHLKPDNIFLAREEDRVRPVPKVLEFGLPKLLGSERVDLTSPDVAVETLAYVSAEQLAGADDVDGRTDVYALGAILYEIVTGRPPFQAVDPVSLALKVASDAPTPPSALCEALPEALDALILRALARDRTQRVPSVEAFMDMLEPFATEAGFRAHMRTPGAELPRRSSMPEEARAAAKATGARAGGLRLVGPLILALGATGAWVAFDGEDRDAPHASRPTPTTAPPPEAPPPAPAPPPALAKEPAQAVRAAPQIVPVTQPASPLNRRDPARKNARQAAHGEPARSARDGRSP